MFCWAMDLLNMTAVLKVLNILRYMEIFYFGDFV